MQGLLATFPLGWIQDSGLSGCWTDGILSLCLPGMVPAQSPRRNPEKEDGGREQEQRYSRALQALCHLICLSLLHKDAPITCPQYSLPAPGTPSPPRIYSVLHAHRRGKHPLEPERPRGSLCVYFHLGWLRSGHHRPESGVGKFRETPGGDSCVLEGLGPLLCPPSIPLSPCNLLFFVERLAELGSGLLQGRRPFGE